MAKPTGPWWRQDRPLSEWELRLVTALSEAHFESTFRDNPSSIVVQIAANSSANWFQAIAAAFMTFGGVHGPLLQTYDFLAGDDPAAEAATRLEAGELVWGWGQGFVKGRLDPILENVDAVAREGQRYEKIAAVQRVMDAKGLFPNPSAYTILTALETDLPRESVPWLVAQLRLPAWSILFQDAISGAGPKGK